jgi:hypothetical protein
VNAARDAKQLFYFRLFSDMRLKDEVLKAIEDEAAMSAQQGDSK